MNQPRSTPRRPPKTDFALAFPPDGTSATYRENLTEMCLYERVR